MITFTDIVLIPIKNAERNRSLFITATPLSVCINDAEFCTIPQGFVSDGASIPGWARWKWKSWGKYSGPSLLHDYLLTTSKYPKWLIDALFYIALRCCNVPALEAAIFWISVRIRRPKRSPPTTVPGVYSS